MVGENRKRVKNHSEGNGLYYACVGSQLPIVAEASVSRVLLFSPTIRGVLTMVSVCGILCVGFEKTPDKEKEMENTAVAETAAQEQAKASLMAHGAMDGVKRVRTVLVTPEELALVPTPAATDTWRPVPHIEVVNTIREMVAGHGWGFVNPDNPFDLAVTETGTKLFGVTTVAIPGYTDAEKNMQLAIGFRHGNDKELAFKVAAGSKVFICSNLIITGDIQITRKHTSGIDIREVLERAFERIPGAAKRLFGWMNNLREMPITVEAGVTLLAEAVEAGALPISDFMTARKAFLLANQGMNPEIEAGGTYWAAYNAVTAQYKKHGLQTNQGYSAALNALFVSKVGNGLYEHNN